MRCKVGGLFDQLLTSLGEGPKNQREEIPPKDRLHVVSSASPEETERKIKAIEAILFKKYGTPRGVIFVNTGVVRPWDHLQSCCN